MAKCILCGVKATSNVQDSASRTIYNCPYCGVYVVSDLATADAARYGSELAAYFASRKLAGINEIVLISYDKAKKDRDYLQLTVKQILSHFPATFSGQMDMALQNLSMLTTYEGEEVKIDSLDMAPIFWVRKKSYDALSFLITSLQKFDYIEVNYYDNAFFPCGIIINPKGWSRISALRDGRITQKTALIVPSGNTDERSELFRRVAEKAARVCGYHVTVSNTASSDGKINLETVALIKNSRFLITDLTCAGAAAYYAVGMSASLGRKNILTCHRDERKALQMDAEQFSILSWLDEQQLYLEIQNAIRALVE